MMFEADPVDHGFDGGIQQFNQHHQNNATDQQHFFYGGLAQPHCQGRCHDKQENFLSKGFFVCPYGPETRYGKEKSIDYALYAFCVLVCHGSVFS